MRLGGPLVPLVGISRATLGEARQALAERALRLDRYTDSRYVRLAELLTMLDAGAIGGPVAPRPGPSPQGAS